MITVFDIKTIVPEADIIQLDPNARYLVVLRAGSTPPSTAEGLGRVLTSLGIKAGVLLTRDPEKDIRILEMNEEQNGRD